MTLRIRSPQRSRAVVCLTRLALAVGGVTPVLAARADDAPWPLLIRPVDAPRVAQYRDQVSAEGWLVMDAYDLPDALRDFAAAGAVYKLTLDCRVAERACTMLVADLTFRGELHVGSRRLALRSWSQGRLVLAEATTCQQRRWVLDTRAHTVTVDAALDRAQRSEMDACPEHLALSAHLGTLTEALGNARLDPALQAAQALPPGLRRAELEAALGTPDAISCGACTRTELHYGNALEVSVSSRTQRVLAIRAYGRPLWQVDDDHP